MGFVLLFLMVLLLLSACFSFNGQVPLLQGCYSLLGVDFRRYSSDSLLRLEMSLEETGEQQSCVPTCSSGTSDLEGQQPDASKIAPVIGCLTTPVTGSHPIG